jgi:hypothetical protein
MKISELVVKLVRFQLAQGDREIVFSDSLPGEYREFSSKETPPLSFEELIEIAIGEEAPIGEA